MSKKPKKMTFLSVTICEPTKKINKWRLQKTPKGYTHMHGHTNFG